MRIILSFLAVISISIAATAQINDPVKWTATSKKTATGHEIVLAASVAKPWHLYSQKTGGAVPTEIKFSKNPLVSIKGDVKEVGSMKSKFEKLFDANVKYYSDKVDFVQTVQVKGNLKTNVIATVNYMVCNDHECLPPTKKTFNIALK